MVAPARAVASRSLSLVSAATPRAVQPAQRISDLRERPRPPLGGWAAGGIALAPAAMSALIAAQAQAEPGTQAPDQRLSIPRRLDRADRRVSAQVIPFPDRRQRAAREALSRVPVDLKV